MTYHLKATFKGYGTITAELWPETAPIGVASVKDLADRGIYDGRTIERLEPDFIIQPLFYDGRDPEIDIMIAPEYIAQRGKEYLRFHRGTVALAGTADEASGSQFYFVLKEKERLNGNFTVIGNVIDGFDVMEKMEQVEVVELLEGGFTYHQPKEPILLERVIVE